jgi:hypothetical protein
MENTTATTAPTEKKHSIHVLSSSITPEVIYRLDAFFACMPPLEFRDHLLELYHNYILHEHDALPYNFNQLAESMILFLDFLKFADEERKCQGM